MMDKKIKNIEKAAERIHQAVENKERIILYGDSDLDGIASVVIMEETIKNVGGQVTAVVFPDRENDGYGINQKALEFLKEKAPALFITLDLGISNVKEIEVANSMGFEVMIIDHHQPLESLPKAKIIVNPRQKGDKSGLDYLCNAGLVFKVSQEILKGRISQNLKNSFLELVALATISDMVPQVEENKIFIEEGLRSLKNTFRPGLKAFFDIFGEGEIVAGGFTKIISALNASESRDFKNTSYELLKNTSPASSGEIVQELIGKSQLKQRKIREITEEVERRIAQNPDEQIIFEGDPAWRLVLAGPVASNIASKYGKPTFIFKRGDEVSVGSVRSLKEGQSSVEAMAACSEFLISYGGHPKASGFRIKNENLEKFKICLGIYFKKIENRE